MNNKIYIGQSKDLSKRFKKYFYRTYLLNRNTLVIHRALLRYGIIKKNFFYLEILGYCDKTELLER